jgi:1-acyl-sn-glycerol-3-phosphate acyltransferase
LELADLIPTGLRSQLEALNPLSRWAELIEEAVDQPAFQQDPEYLAFIVPYMRLFANYFGAEVRDLHRVPDEGGALLVGNHSGGGLTPDTSALWASWYEERGFERPLLGLGFDAAFTVPIIGDIMRKIGQMPASRDNAGKALDEGLPVLVYPGGDQDLFRPWTERNKIDFHGRTGFVKLALHHQVPIVPVVGHGGHDAIFVLTRGEGIARALGSDRVRLGAVPIIWQLPWGVSPPFPLYLPLPAKITVQVCEPIWFGELGPEAADDTEIVQHCYDEVQNTMQESLDALVEEVPYPLLSGLRSWLPG